MKRLTRLLPLSFLIFVVIFSSKSLSISRGITVISKEGQNLYLYKDYHALLVGVSNYDKWPKLPNALKDVNEVAAKLKMIGFKVKLVLDPTYREFKTALTEMTYKMGSEENRAVLFYYAGHGATETMADKTKMGYIIPIDCPFFEKDPLGFATHAISMREIESISLRIRAKHVLMLFDSCFSGSLFSLVRAMPHDITEKCTLPVRQYITAGREDEQVPDRSMFKRCLLIGLDGDADLTGDGYITGSELGMYLADKVINYTRRSQHPQYGKINNPDLDRGDFVFTMRKLQARSGASSSVSLEDHEKGLNEVRETVEREREEVEKLKLEIERNKLEAERQRLEEENKKLKLARRKEREVKLKAEEEKDRTEDDDKNTREEEPERSGAERKKLEMAKLPRTYNYTGLKLAVLPSKLINNAGYIRIETILTEALDIVFKKTTLFIPLFSYYNISYADTKIIDKKFIGKNTFDSLWAKENIFSSFKPNIHGLSTVGEKLNVDAVLTYYIELNHGIDYINAFLIDIRNRKVYDENGTTFGFVDDKEGLPEIIVLTKKVFSDYKRKQK